MPKFLDKFVDRMVVWSYKNSEAARLEGIGLVDFRGHGDAFVQTIQSSLRLIQHHDPRRYKRIGQHISWIVNQVNNPQGAQYLPQTHTLLLLFDEARDLPRDIVIAFYASILVHVATHGLIASRGIEMTCDNAVQIERLCVAELNRFVARLSDTDPIRYPPEMLNRRFIKQYWYSEWDKSPSERAISVIKRTFEDHKTG